MRILVATALVLTGLSMTGQPAVAGKDIKVGRTTGMYNDRYCEYLFVRLDGSKLVGDVWNTYGLNKCPASQWKASDAAALKDSVPGTLAVKLNGPRHWLIDRASITFDKKIQPLSGTVKSFFGLRMRMLTTVDVPVVNGVPGISPYAETIVNRRTNFTFSRRRSIHELVSPEGHLYAMQAYSQIKDPGLTRRDLNGLGSVLTLPEGWKYRTRDLKHDLTLRTFGKTTVLQDELENTYQLEK